MSTRAADPEVSIVIPVYNEEGILSAALADLTEKLAEVDWTYEILVAENGSTDATVAIAQQFSERHPEVHVFSTGEPNYGKALKEGILRARGTYVICDEIDLCDVAFYHVAMAQLKHAGFDFVVGSKRAQGSRDRRPGYRRAATTVLNGMLRVATGFQGTDTHGLKAFRRETVLPVVQACVVDRDMFASELVVRVHRDGGLRWTEVPIDLLEKRPPSIHLFKRVPNVLRNMVRLTAIIRFGRDLKR
jgi:glycosyltransferase involved in cell wall biosynthesis